MGAIWPDRDEIALVITEGLAAHGTHVRPYLCAQGPLIHKSLPDAGAAPPGFWIVSFPGMVYKRKVVDGNCSPHCCADLGATADTGYSSC